MIQKQLPAIGMAILLLGTVGFVVVVLTWKIDFKGSHLTGAILVAALGLTAWLAYLFYKLASQLGEYQHYEQMNAMPHVAELEKRLSEATQLLNEARSLSQQELKQTALLEEFKKILEGLKK